MKKNNLKSGILKLGLALSFVFLSTSTFAIKNEKKENMPTDKEAILETKRTIKQHISFPTMIFPLAKREKVEVVFTTDEKGKVDFVMAKTENELLKKAIERQFLELTLTKIKSNVAYSIMFNIKKI